MGCLGSKLWFFLVGQHQDSNSGPPACESGVVTITLQGATPHLNSYSLVSNSDLFSFGIFNLFEEAISI